LDLSGWNTANVTSFFTTFSGCSSLTSLDLSGWSVGATLGQDSPLHNFVQTFNGCSNLTTLDVSHLITDKVTNLLGAFTGCSKLSTLVNSQNWDTRNITSFYQTFANCTALTSLNVSTWDVSNVTDADGFEYAFSGCALNRSTVDAILAMCDRGGRSNIRLDFGRGGGSNAAPTDGNNNVNLLSLRAKGWTVTFQNI
jgi:surface protein